MPVERFIEEYKDGKLFNRVPYQVSDEELYRESLMRLLDETKEKCIYALDHWSSLTAQDKDDLLLNLLYWSLAKDNRLHNTPKP